MNRNRYLKERIIKILYDNFKKGLQYKYSFEDGFSGHLPDFSEEEISLAVKDLQVLGYIDIGISKYQYQSFLVTSDLTKKGISYVDKYLHDDDHSFAKSQDNTEAFLPWDTDYILRGDDMLPCFQIEAFAHAIVKLLDLVSESENSSIAMFGLFAPWGRGKSYLVRAVSEHLHQRKYWVPRVRHLSKKKKIEMNLPEDIEPLIAYDTITFNAWKYQDTPALWAYLYETLVRSKSTVFRFFYSLWRNAFLFLRDLIFFAIPLILTYLISSDSTWRISAWLLSGSGVLIRFFLREYDSIFTIFKKYSKAVSFKNQLGVRSLIEDELKHLFVHWIPPKKVKSRKIVLFVDDLDRCRPEIMLDIIESLRLILEQDEIKERLIVVCCIDPSVLYSVMMTKYKSLYSDRSIKEMIKDQFDKLFLATLSLPPISLENMEEYLDALNEYDLNVGIGDKSLFTLSYQQALRDPLKKNVLNTEPSLIELEYKLLTDSMIIRLLKESIIKSHLTLTPRQVNRLYYRCIFACILLFYITKRPIDSIVDRSLIEGIVIRSYGDGKINKTFKGIIDMVVPYSEYVAEC